MSNVNDRTFRPDVIVLEHDHTTQVVAMSVNPAYEHSIFLHYSESGGRFPGASKDPVISIFADKL